MTKSKKLKKIIEYAVENGWKYSFNEEEIEKLIRGHDAVIWRHDFAKAVFGKEYKTEHFVETPYYKHEYASPAWMYHLKQVVISEDPIDYYYQYIKKQK